MVSYKDKPKENKLAVDTWQLGRMLQLYHIKVKLLAGQENFRQSKPDNPQIVKLSLTGLANSVQRLRSLASNGNTIL